MAARERGGHPRIRRFGSPADLAALEQMVKDYPEHRRSPLIVVDMRGNGGGSDSYAYRWVNQARRGPWGTNTWDRVDHPEVKAKLNELRGKWPRSAADLAVQLRVDSSQGEAKVPYRGRVFVLVDRRAGSSGESGAMAFQAGVGATIVGERTSGTLEYGNNRAGAAPDAPQAPVRDGAQLLPTQVEGVGIPADVYLAPELMTWPAEKLIPLLPRLSRSSTAPAGTPPAR